MPFHVEITSLIDRLRVIDIGEPELREKVLGPWVVGLPFEFRGCTWRPRESRLTVLCGPVPSGKNAADADRAWEALSWAASDVTRAQLETAEASAPLQTAAIVEANSLEMAIKSLRGRPPRQIHWGAALDRLNRRDPAVTAVILVVRRPEGDWPQI